MSTRRREQGARRALKSRRRSRRSIRPRLSLRSLRDARAIDGRRVSMKRRLLRRGCMVQMKTEADPRIAELRTKTATRDQIVSAILPPIGDGTGHRERSHTLLKLRSDVLKPGLVELVHTIGDERRQDIEAGIEEDPVIDREQQVVDRAVNPSRGIMLFPTARRHDQHRASACKCPFAETVSPMRVAMLADAIGEAIGIYPIDPALEDRRHRIPPERKLKDERVGPQQLLLLDPHVFGERLGRERLAGSRSNLQTRVRSERWEVRPTDLRFPAHGVKVGNPHFVALGFQFADRDIAQRRRKGSGFGVSEDEEHIHGGGLPIGESRYPR